MANTDPVADTAGVVEQVWRLGREAGWAEVAPGRCGDRRAGRRAAGRARGDGRVGRPGPGVQRRRPLRLRRRAHAAGPGVRQGLRRGGGPARPGAAADRGRADARGGAVRDPRAAGLAGGRRGGDHRPRRAAHRARRLAAARLPRLDRGVGRDPALGQEPRGGRDGRGHAPPPDAHRRPGGDVRPAVQGEPATAHRGRRAGRCGPLWPTARSTRSRPTTPRTPARTRTASGRRPRSA